MTVNRAIVEEAAAGAPRASARVSDATSLPHPSWRRAKWLIGLRPLLVTVVIGTALLIDIPTSAGMPVEFGIFLLVFSCVLSGLCFVTLPLAIRIPWLIDAQLAVDVVAISILVLLTGGSQSNFVPLYVLPILAGGVVRMTRGGLTIAGISAGLFGLVVASQFGLLVPQPHEWGLALPTTNLLSPRLAFYSVGLHCIGFLAVAKLTGYLAENLHRADLRLQRASSTLADLKAYQQHVIDSLTGGLCATDVHGRVLMFNRAAETITGETAAAVLGRPIAEVLQMPASMRRSLREVVEPGRANRSEFNYIRRSGQQMELGLSIGPLIGGTGQVGYLFTFQDLTEYKRREREEQRQKRLAAVGEMAAGIAHEIRNPLASMAGSMQVLRQELDLNAEQTQLFDIVLRESDRLNDTIRNFLAYARPHPSRITTVDVRRVLNEAAQLIRNNPERQARHEVEVVLPGHDVTCAADEAQIRQIVWNLATNGIRAMPEGGALTLSATAEPAGVIIRVSDRGVGMTPETLDRIFQPFHGGFAKGAGLGLSIVHRIVTDHGGEIRVSSAPGKGTAVEIHLPARAASADAAPANHSEQTMVA